MEKGVIWDMDGVLVDTGEFHYLSWVAILKDYDIPFSFELFRSTFGMNNTGVLTAVLGHPPEASLLAEVAGRKEAAFRDAVRDHIQPMPGVVVWLSQFQSWGFRQAVASSAPAANITTIMESTHLAQYFDVCLSGVDLPPKPAPNLFLKAAAAIGAAPANCIVMEDAVVGVQAAKSAGMACIAVLTTNTAASLHQADIIIPHLDQLSVESVSQFLTTGRSF
jgi:HAD superfamily hydrolase (TIGR01509 family)